jgi:hypothetical protein
MNHKNKERDVPLFKPIQGWGFKKRKKDCRIFVGLLFGNNIYFKLSEKN